MFGGQPISAAIMAVMPSSTEALVRFEAGDARVAVYGSASEAGAAAASKAAELIRAAIAKRGRARIIGATGNSQIPLVDALVREDLDWNAVELFHMDEYVGLPATHPSSFRYWMKTRVEDRVHPRATHYIEGDARDLPAEISRYVRLLNEAPIDLAFVGFGENGHIAFNDPPVADFHDNETMKVITLDDACRRQQAGEGHFPDVASVPAEAVTITCPGLFRAASWVCCVPELRKSEAVRNALEGPISEACPASLARTHANTFVYLDSESASRLSAVAAGSGRNS
jgi:glucosamine-6-phosphate deaminase